METKQYTKTLNETFLPKPMYAWTEHRLSLVLRRLLTHIPTTIKSYFFIDGLDEFDGEEADLMSLVRLLNQTPQAKVCVSTRPEQIHRQGFAQSPQIKLHDLNFPDLNKAAEHRLYPILISFFPEKKIDVELLIGDTIYKAQGVFLWLELIIKSLNKGACNADTMDELHGKLKETPDTIGGIYQHMLDGLDQSHLSESLKYFGRVASDSTPTLLHFLFGDSDSLTHVARTNRGYFTSSEFIQHCVRIETRIVTRCAGLVEIQERPSPELHGMDKSVYDPNGGTLHAPKYRYSTFRETDPEDPDERLVLDSSVLMSRYKQNPSRHLREVRFIHKTVGDFLRDRFEKLFPDPDKRLATYPDRLRALLGVMNLIPIMVAHSELVGKVLTFFPIIEDIMDHLIRLEGSETVRSSNHAFGDTIVATVNQTYRDIKFIDAALNGPSITWFENYGRDSINGSVKQYLRITPTGDSFVHGSEMLPFHSPAGFAAFFGCQSHVLTRHSLRAYSHEQTNYLLASTVAGLQLLEWNFQPHRVCASFAIIRELLHHEASCGSTSYVTPHSWAGDLIPLSTWVAFLSSVVPAMLHDYARSAASWPGLTNCAPTHFARVNELLKDIVTSFVSNRADVNASIFSTKSWTRTDINSTSYTLLAVLEEKPLSFIEVAQPSRGPDPLGMLNNMLWSHGGIEGRRCHFVCLREEYRASSANYHHLLLDRWYRPSPPQSDCLCDLMQSYPIDFFYDLPSSDNTDPELLRRLEEFLLSLTENDLVPSRDGKPRFSVETASSSGDAGSPADEADVSFAGSEEDDGWTTDYEDNERGGD